MCNRVICIEDGRVHRDGPPKEVIAEYRRMLRD